MPERVRSTRFDKKKITNVYKVGKKNGVLNTYYENGQIMIEENYKNDILNGKLTTYYESGQIMIKGKYKDDKQDETWTYFDENGINVKVETYEKGALILLEED